ncbi:MAG TPA: hypothetical protein DEP46_11240 [Blastocatellia bacterium]|nr:hypothetical protein [Blastocatellia bacterium]
MEDNTVTLKLSLHRALLGEVTENLIAVTARIDGLKILIRAYYDYQATESEAERISLVATEVIADFLDHFPLRRRFDLLASKTIWKSSISGLSVAQTSKVSSKCR